MDIHELKIFREGIFFGRAQPDLAQLRWGHYWVAALQKEVRSRWP